MALQLESQPRCATLFARRPAARAVRRQHLAVRAAQPDSRGPAPPSSAGSSASGAGASSSAAGPPPPSPPPSPPQAVELPGGALWWQHLHSRGTTPLYGSNFVLQRPTVGGPGLIKASRPPPPVRVPAPAPPSPPMVWHAPGSGAGLGLTLASGSLGAGSVVVDTEFVVLPGQHPHRLLPQPGEPVAGSAASSIAPNTTCTGIVWQRSADPEEGQEEGAAARQLRGRRRGSSRHPRRTQMLRYTCNLCGEVNDCEVNPHAWSKGSVFARCQGCTAVHKLKDNLRIFHELAGPVFPPRELRSHYLVQEILDRIQENNRN